MGKVKITKNKKPSDEAKDIIEAFKKHGKDAFNDAKKNGGAYIIEGGYIVKVLPDDTRIKIKYVGETSIKCPFK